MTYENFLIDAYFGSLDTDRFNSFREFEANETTQGIIYIYGIIAVLAKLEAARKSGRSINADLNVLAYFLEEARQIRKLNQRVFSTRQERLHRKITSTIVSGIRGSGVSQEAN